MNRRSTTLLIALCLSAGLHAAMFLAFPSYEVGGVAVDWPADGLTRAGEMTVTLEVEPEAEPAPETEPPKEFETGDRAGTGYASHAVPDKVEAAAPEGDADQAFLSLDPTGTGERGDDPVATEATGEGAALGNPGGTPPPLVAAVVTPPGTKALTPFGLNPQMKLPRLVPKAPPEPAVVVQPGESPTDGGEEAVATPVDARPQPIPPTPPVPLQPTAVAIVESPNPTPTPAPSPNNGGARAGGSQQPAADPARMSDSESDPFSRLGTAVVRDGRLDIRFGRKVKTRRPKLLLAGQVDLFTLRRTQVVLKIEIDATGKVTSVKVVKSSGSNEIDQPTRVAVYDWWFEPKKDVLGQPVADEVQFTIGWR